MRESHVGGVANHDDPEPCIGAVRAQVKRGTGARMGWVLSREMHYSGVPTPLSEAEGNTIVVVIARCRPTLRGRRPHARTEPLCARTGRTPGRPPRWCEGPRREGAMRHEPTTNGPEKSDGLVVPTKSPNEAGLPVEEVAEGRARPRGTWKSKPRPGHRAGSTRPLRSTVCVKQHERIGRRSSPRSCIT